MRPTLKMLQGMEERAEKRAAARREAPQHDKLSARLTALFEERADIERTLKRLRQVATNGSVEAFASATKGALARADASHGVAPEVTHKIAHRISQVEQRFAASVSERIAMYEALLRSVEIRIAAAGGPKAPPAAPAKDTKRSHVLRMPIRPQAFRAEPRGAVKIPSERAKKAPESAPDEKHSGKVG